MWSEPLSAETSETPRRAPSEAAQDAARDLVDLFRRLRSLMRSLPAADLTPTQSAVLRRLCQHLRPGGYLFLGHSESLAGLELPVRSVASTVFRRG